MIEREDGKAVVVRTNPLVAQTTTVPVANIASREVSPVSPMPPGLINVLSQAQILDLLAYLESGGDPEDTRTSHPSTALRKARPVYARSTIRRIESSLSITHIFSRWKQCVILSGAEAAAARRIPSLCENARCRSHGILRLRSILFAFARTGTWLRMTPGGAAEGGGNAQAAGVQAQLTCEQRMLRESGASSGALRGSVVGNSLPGCRHDVRVLPPKPRRFGDGSSNKRRYVKAAPSK